VTARSSVPEVDKFVTNICVDCLTNMNDASIIKCDPDTGEICALFEATVLTRHSVSFETMKLIMKLPRNTNLPVVRSVSLCCLSLLYLAFFSS
jgi:hypothetical protein